MRNWLEYIPFIIIASLVKVLPRNQALWLGRTLGSCARRLQPHRVRLAEENIRLALPELSAEAIPGTIKDTFKHLGMSFIEMLRLGYYLDARNVEKYINIRGIEHVKDALRLGRGCIILTGHVGFWETGTIFLPYSGIPTGFVAKPMRNTLVDAYFTRMREAGGGYIINSKRGARGIFKALQSNHAVCILMDQHIKGRGSAAVPFFGRPAHTTTIITELAMKYRVPIVPAFSYRSSDNTYYCIIQPMLLLEGELNEANVLANTTRLNKYIEEAIRIELPQWFWVHRRWRDCCEHGRA